MENTLTLPILQPQQRGYFGPSISLDRLEVYRDIADEQADTPVREAMHVLCDMAEGWLGTTEAEITFETAKAKGKERPQGGFIVPLSKETIKELDPYVPYPHEVLGLETLFNGVQAAESARNSQKVVAWKQVVFDLLFKKHFPNMDKKRFEAMNLLVSQCRGEKCGYGELLTMAGESKASIAKFVETYNALQNDFAASLAYGGNPPVPRPTMENTDLRDAAGHLLWLAKELLVDRIPITDNLRPRAMRAQNYPQDVPITIRPLTKHKSKSKSVKQ